MTRSAAQGLFSDRMDASDRVVEGRVTVTQVDIHALELHWEFRKTSLVHIR